MHAVAALTLVTAAASAQTTAGASADATLTMSVAAGPALPLGSAAERWAALLREADPRLSARVRPGAVLAHRDPAREFLALRDGAADLAVGSALQWSLQVPALAVFALPWIAPQDGDLVALVSDARIREALAARLAGAGVVLVALGPLGYREIATSSRPVRSPQDLKGLRLRAAPSPLLHDLLLALGAVPQAMSFREAQAALASGALDGQEGSPSSLAMSRGAPAGHRPAYLTDWGAVADAMVFAVRKPAWDAWSEEQRVRVREAAQRTITETDALARDAAAIAALGRNGVALVRITPAGHAAFREAAAQVDARWRDAVGRELVEQAEAIVARRRAAPDKR